MYSPDVVSFAREKGYFKGKDADFSFAKLIARMISAPCVDARLVYGLSSVNMIPRWISMMDFIKGDPSKEPMPLYVKPNRKLSVQDVQNGMRDITRERIWI